MQFSTRNACYLRASNYRVIPLFLYLDERHVSGQLSLTGFGGVVDVLTRSGRLDVG